MRVTDEMVEAAVKVHDMYGSRSRRMRAAIEAALAAAPQAASPSDADRDYADMQRMQAALIAKTHECIELRVRNAAALHAVERVAREAEREACAQVAENFCSIDDPFGRIAAAIRSRAGR